MLRMTSGAAIILTLEHGDGVDLGQAPHGHEGGDEGHEKRGPANAQEVLPADEDDELGHEILGEGGNEDGEAGAQEEPDGAGYQALLEHDAVEEAVGEPLCLEYAILPRLLHRGSVDREAGHSQTDDKGHYKEHDQYGQDITHDPAA